MSEDAERVDESGEAEEEEPEEVVKVEKEEEPKKKGPRKNPLGFILNIRMLRRVVQILFLLGINGYIFTAWYGAEQVTAFWTWFQSVLPAIPILSSLQAPFATIAGSFDTIQYTLTRGVFPFFVIGAMIIILTIIGRAGCGWACPIGTIQDFVTLPKRKKFRPAPGTESELRKVKAYIFVVVGFLAVWMAVAKATGSSATLEAALGIFADDAFAPLNPAYILFVILPNQTWPTSLDTLWFFSTWGWVWLQVAFVSVVLIVSFWIPRWFCRWLCPAGFLYGIFSKEALIGIGRNPARCTPDTCNVCEVVCPMNIRIRKFPYQHVHSPDCIMCLECKSHCPNDAIVLKFS
ncbi:MAG: 4Fe-4S binding protein [Candidatus Thorarchaeota archaeon]